MSLLFLWCHNFNAITSLKGFRHIKIIFEMITKRFVIFLLFQILLPDYYKRFAFNQKILNLLHLTMFGRFFILSGCEYHKMAIWLGRKLKIIFHLHFSFACHSRKTAQIKGDSFSFLPLHLYYLYIKLTV